jgi:hypothetical protein
MSPGVRCGHVRAAGSEPAAHRVHAWVEDAIRTGKDCGTGRYPSTSLAMNKAWQAALDSRIPG